MIKNPLESFCFGKYEVLLHICHYYKNFSKRVIKTPKLYFVDTGLLRYLLAIRNIEQSKVHSLLGSIFETFVISEAFKRYGNLGEKAPLYFWRDQSQCEIDLLIETGNALYPIEVKLSQTYQEEFKKPILQ